MVLRAFPSPFGAVSVAGGQTSSILDLGVPPGEKNMFVRLVALFRDNEPLRGEAPEFLIRASTGIFTSVIPGSSAVTIKDGVGRKLGSVACERSREDVFFLKLSDLAENSGPWRLRIRNNDSEALRYMGFTSVGEDKTLQPWLVIGGPDDRRPGEAFFRIISDGARLRDIEIRNLGTAPLKISQAPGPLSTNGDVKLTEIKPALLGVHGVGRLRFECVDDAVGRVEESLTCNDTIEDHRKFVLVMSKTPHPRPSPSPGGGGGVDPNNPPM